MEVVLILVAAAAVIAVVTSPFRRARTQSADAGQRAGGDGPSNDARIAELEAAREAKYREIRDAELDHQTGKLSDEDFKLVDGALRAEAIEILTALDDAGAGAPGEDATGAAAPGEAATGEAAEAAEAADGEAAEAAEAAAGEAAARATAEAAPGEAATAEPGD